MPPHQEGGRRLFRWLVPAVAIALLVAAGLLLTRHTTLAASCDIWIGGVNNNFGTAGNWSTGAVPGSADDACITATTSTVPPAVADTYSVVLSGGPSVHSLTLGGPNGKQTVVLTSGAQLSLGGAASTINANGVLTLGDAGAGLTVLSGPGSLTNSGRLNTFQGGGGTRYLRVNLTNAGGGTVNIAAASSFQDSATSTTNDGTVTIEASGGLGLFGPASFTNGEGSVINNGAFSMNGNATFVQRAGTEAGTPVFLNNGSTLDDDVGSGAGLFTFFNGAATLTGSGPNPGVAAGQLVTIGAGTGTQATLGVNLMNAGTITMGDTGGGYSILCCAPRTLTNTGHLNTIQGGGGTRYLRVNILNGPAGTIDIAAGSTFQDGASGATTTTNQGTVGIEASGGFGLFGPGSFINSGGSVINSGAFSVSGNATFMQRGGAESGTPVFFNNGSTLDDDVGGGAGLFTFLNSLATLTGTGPTPGIAAGQMVTIGAGNGTQTNLGANLTNAGTIVMGDAGAGYSILCCAANTLTNTGHLNTIQGGGGTRYLRANILNGPAGTIDIAAGSTFQDGASGATTTTNQGTVGIEASGGFGLFGPGSFINSGGSVINSGAFSVSGNATFMQRGGAESGTPVFFNNGSTLDDDVGGGAGLFTFLNSLATLTGTGPTPGIAAGQVVTIGAGSGTQTNLGVDLTNAGTITMGDAGGGSSVLCCAPRTLTNTGHLNTVKGGGGTRYVRLNVVNAAAGSIDIAGKTYQDAANGATTTTNNGTLTLEVGDSLSLGGASVFAQGSGGTLATTIDANADNWGVIAGLGGGGSVSLDGKLKVTTVGLPGIGTSFPIISMTSRSGKFASFDRGGINYAAQYLSAGVTLIVEPARLYHPLLPVRILDTRTTVGGHHSQLGPDAFMSIPVTGVGGVPDAATAVVINVTVTNTTAASFLTVWPTGVARPLASNLNWTAGTTVPNLVEVAVGSDGMVSFYNARGATDVVADMAGYVGAPTAALGPDGLFNPVVPDRVLDTRIGKGAPQAPVGPGQTITVQISGVAGSGVPASGVAAVVLNVTVTNPTAASYLTVFPAGTSPPLASNLNFVAGQTVPNRVIVKLGSSGAISIFNASGSVEVLADVGGWFTDLTQGSEGTTFTGITPTRILDTRQGQGPLGPNQTRAVPVAGLAGVPAMTSLTPPTAVVLNVTVTNTTAPSFLTVWPEGATQPVASDLNFVAGQTIPNLVVVRIGADGNISLSNASGSTDVVIDVVGYYS